MNEVFKGFYKSNEDELREIWNSSSTLFIFDTNCLLNLYRCENQTRDDTLNLMKLISQRVWIPFQVGYEYQINRKEVIYNSLSSLEKVKKTLKDTINSTTASITPLKKNLYSALNSEIVKLKEEITSPIEDFIKSNIEPRIEQKKNIAKSDSIRTEIDKIIGSKCGQPPTQDSIDAINTKGEYRYLNSLPPGYRDAGKNDEGFFGNVKLKNKFGDLYIWMEIIDKAKEDGVNNIIFICDDNKPDWWYISNGETHGAHAHLLTEIYSETTLQAFKMINQSTFLYDGARFLRDAKVEESSVEEMKSTYHYHTDAIFDSNLSTDKSVLNKSEYHDMLSYYTKSENEEIEDLKSYRKPYSHSVRIIRLLNVLSAICSKANALLEQFDISLLPDDHAEIKQHYIGLLERVIQEANSWVVTLEKISRNLSLHRKSPNIEATTVTSKVQLQIDEMKMHLEITEDYLDKYAI